MSINRVNITKVTSPTQLPFAMLEGEMLRYRSQSTRQSLALKSKNPQGPITVNIAAAGGHLFVTNQRFIYISEAAGDVESFSYDFASIVATQFSHALKSPWFGPNHWEFLFFSSSKSSCDGFPKDEWFEGKISFKDGGLFEFAAVMDAVINDVVNNSHIDDELPSYSAT